MGVYIKGMEMPRSCKECGIRGVYCRTYIGFHHKDTARARKCPLVEIEDEPQLVKESIEVVKNLVKPQTECKIKKEDFGTLCICAIRYSMGRKTYVPTVVQDIIRTHLSDLSENDINVMLQDKEFQARINAYGDPCDMAAWLTFWDDLVRHLKERKQTV